DRREGLNQAVREAPATVAAELLVCELEEARFARQLERAMRAPSPPTVVIASNSTLAAWVIRALHALQLRCPEEVSLLTFGEPDWADLVSPRLSFVRQPIHEIAVSAWELLIQRMNKDSGKPRLLEL